MYRKEVGRKSESLLRIHRRKEGIDRIKTFVYNHGKLDTGRGVELMGTICEAYETHRDELMYRPGDVVVKVKVTIIRVRIIFQLKYNKKTIVISRIVNNLV